MAWLDGKLVCDGKSRKTGKPCSRPPVKGSRFCITHGAYNGRNNKLKPPGYKNVDVRRAEREAAAKLAAEEKAKNEENGG